MSRLVVFRQERGACFRSTLLSVVSIIIVGNVSVCGESKGPFPFPGDVALYGGVENAAASAQFVGTAGMRAFMNDPNMVTWTKESLPRLLKFVETAIGVNVNTVLGQLDGRFGYAVWEIDPAAETSKVKVGLAFGLSGDGMELLEIINTKVSTIEAFEPGFSERTYGGVTVFRLEGPKISYGILGTYFVVALGENAFETMIDVQQGKRPGLDESALIKGMREDVPAEGVSQSSIDCAGVLEKLMPVLPPTAPQILKAFGLDNLKRITSWQVPGKALDPSVTRLSFVGPRHGLFSFVGGTPHPWNSAKWVDADADLYLAACVDDWNAGWDRFTSMAVTAAGPNGAAMAMQLMVMAQAEMGFSLRGDLFAGLGNEVALSARSSGLVPSVEIFFQVKDRGAMERVMAGIGKQLQVDYRSYTCEGLTYQAGEPGVIPVRFTYAFVDDFMILSFDESAMRQSLRLAKEAKGSLADKASYRERVAALGETGIIIYSDTARRLKDVLPLINVAVDAALQAEEPGYDRFAVEDMSMRMSPLAKIRAMGLSVHDFPNPYILCDYLTPSVIGVRAEEEQVDIIALSGEGGIPVPMLGGMLAAIAVPNFLEAQKRSKIAGAKSGMRNLSVALECYRIDFNSYPIPMDETGVPVKPDENGVFTGFLPTSLTSPISYMTELPKDPFNEGYTYRYSTNALMCWIMASPGLDKVAEGDISAYADPKRAACDLSKFMSGGEEGGGVIVYDPTNGTASSGDIIRTGP